MKIEVNIDKGKFLVILSVLFVIAGLIVVYAYNPSYVNGQHSDAQPAIMGHTLDEIFGLPGCTTGQAIVKTVTNTGWGCADLPSGQTYTYSSGATQGFHVSNAALYGSCSSADMLRSCPHRWCVSQGWISGIVVEWYNGDNYVVCFK